MSSGADSSTIRKLRVSAFQFGAFLLNLDLRRPLKRRFRIGICDFGNSQKIPKICVFTQKSCKIHQFEIFTQFPKSRIWIRNRHLGGLLRSKFNKKDTIGKLRVSAFQRLKNQRLRTSPSKVMVISHLYKNSVKLLKFH